MRLWSTFVRMYDILSGMRNVILCVLKLVREHKVIVALVLLLIIAAFTPSIDKCGEVHGNIKAGRFLIGNGVLVGCSQDGEDKVAFLTCRHVLTERMLQTGRAFIEDVSPDNAINIREKGKAFRYVSLSNIDPKRWLTVPDVKYDFAWMILTTEECARIFGSNGSAIYVDLVKNDSDLGFESIADILNACRTKDAEVEMCTTLAPVIGRNPATAFYLPSLILIPGFGRYLALSTMDDRQIVKPSVVQVPIITTSLEGMYRVARPCIQFTFGGHVNNSGSPVFAEMKDSDKTRCVLLGLVIAGFGETMEIGAFQPIDFVCSPILDTLRGGVGTRLIDWLVDRSVQCSGKNASSGTTTP